MPQIKIISPVENQTILGDKVTISFIVGNLEVGREGHLHIWLDNPILTASTAGEITSNFNYLLTDVSAGNHKLTLEVVKPDHRSFSPVVSSSIYFTSVLPETPTTTPTPRPQNIISPVSFINWQQILLIAAVVSIAIGCFIKVKTS